jgi:hypothetical protein
MSTRAHNEKKFGDWEEFSVDASGLAGDNVEP